MTKRGPIRGRRLLKEHCNQQNKTGNQVLMLTVAAKDSHIDRESYTIDEHVATNWPQLSHLRCETDQRGQGETGVRDSVYPTAQGVRR